jgi:hypothetical protein
MPQSQKLAQYLLQAFDRHECTIDEIFTTALNQFSEKLKNYLEAITHARN